MNTIFDAIKGTPIYQEYVGPLVWAPIKAYRGYYEWRRELCFQKLARQDTVRLAEARRRLEANYAADDAKPLVSVMVLTYNRGRLLMERTLPSVLSQTYKHFEVVIVGDHCTDETVELMATIKDPRVRFTNLPERPRYPRNKEERYKIAGYKAGNLALDMVRGSWNANLDDDDVFTPDHIETLLHYAQAGNYEFVSGRCKAEIRTGQWIEKGSLLSPNGRSLGQVSGHVSHSTVLYRSYIGDCFRYSRLPLKVGLPGDAFRWRRMVNAGVRVGFLNRIVTTIPLRPGEISRGIFQPD